MGEGPVRKDPRPAAGSGAREAPGHVQEVGDGGLHGGRARSVEVHVDHVVSARGADEGQGASALSLGDTAPSATHPCPCGRAPAPPETQARKKWGVGARSSWLCEGTPWRHLRKGAQRPPGDSRALGLLCERTEAPPRPPPGWESAWGPWGPVGPAPLLCAGLREAGVCRRHCRFAPPGLCWSPGRALVFCL